MKKQFPAKRFYLLLTIGYLFFGAFALIAVNRISTHDNDITVSTSEFVIKDAVLYAQNFKTSKHKYYTTKNNRHTNINRSKKNNINTNKNSVVSINNELLQRRNKQFYSNSSSFATFDGVFNTPFAYSPVLSTTSIVSSNNVKPGNNSIVNLYQLSHYTPMAISASADFNPSVIPFEPFVPNIQDGGNEIISKIGPPPGGDPIGPPIPVGNGIWILLGMVGVYEIVVLKKYKKNILL